MDAPLMRKVLQKPQIVGTRTVDGSGVYGIVPANRRGVGKAACATAPHETPMIKELGPRVREGQAAMPQILGAEMALQRIGVRACGQTKRVSRLDTAPYRAV